MANDSDSCHVSKDASAKFMTSSEYIFEQRYLEELNMRSRYDILMIHSLLDISPNLLQFCECEMGLD